MAASALYSGTVFVPPLSHKTPKHVRSICFNPSISLPRSRFCAIVAAPSLSRRVFRVHGLMDDESGTAPKPESPNSEGSASIDLKLPRRSLLVQFTCVCGERTKRLVNRLAYERGAVFVQCAGCRQYHKLVDNLGLITEYDFRDDSETDRV
ncbi:DNL-type zinc finger protein isoform X2 [Vigna radiata var. radiata]|uniref:DNL-type zinc finger protein isoform X2 n=1 Tax=Vigna radiata var. radiata TaxID=3916 RepID=A0A1S3VQA6_VIGRR|nr:DNL-type zinc finger protein isoform X2 [Vigna radiata var. radiata]